VKKLTTGALSTLLILTMLAGSFYPCTTFCLKGGGEILYGANYDFDIGDGLIFVNKRGVQKVSTTSDEGNPVKWISKYGSITFNQFGRENPIGGINEKGLVVELMWLDETAYPKADKRPTLDVLEWIQYQLDTAATAAEVISSTEAMRLTSDIKLHYLISDADGNSATVEFINGALVAHSGPTLSVAALTNNTYDSSVKYFHESNTGKATTDGSFDRFYRTAGKIKDFGKRPKSGMDAVNYAFDMLADASEKGYSSLTSKTQWSIVYDQKRSRIYFRTLKDPAIKSIDAKAFDLGCRTAVKMLDVNIVATGDITPKFLDYTRRANRDLIERSFTGTIFLKDVPKFYRDLAAAYPEEFPCTER
jgi:penicillin V acylase-like amidase (Ntn superfamily)